MIPGLIKLPGVPHGILPPGIYWSDLTELQVRFATNPRRKKLFEGIERVVTALDIAGCTAVYVDGSYVTGKPDPGDFDGCWDPVGVDPKKLDPVLLDFKNKRAAQKAKFGGEMFIASAPSGANNTFLEFFQIEKGSGTPKGIVGLKLPKGGTP